MTTPDQPDLSLALPGPAPATFTVMPHPTPGEKRVVMRIARPGSSLVVEIEPQDAAQLASHLQNAALAANSGLIIPPNGHGGLSQ